MSLLDLFPKLRRPPTSLLPEPESPATLLQKQEHPLSFYLINTGNRICQLHPMQAGIGSALVVWGEQCKQLEAKLAAAETEVDYLRSANAQLSLTKEITEKSANPKE